MPTPAAKITLKPLAPGVELDDLEPVLEAAAALLDSVAELLGSIPPHANPVVIHRRHLAELQAASDAFASIADPLLEVREVPATEAQMTDKAALSPDRTPVQEPPRRPAGGALERAGYQDGDLVDAFRKNPGGQA